MFRRAPRMPRTTTGRKLLEERLVERQDGHAAARDLHLHHVSILNPGSRGVRTAAEARMRAFHYGMMAL